MHKLKERGWRHPGRRSSDYSHSKFNDHDKRTFASARSFVGIGPRGYTRSDVDIREEVCEILYWDPDVDASDIEVRVENQCVFLDGFVDSRHAKKRAEAIVENVSGIVDVYNNLSLKPTLDIDSDKIITRGDEGLFSQETLQR